MPLPAFRSSSCRPAQKQKYGCAGQCFAGLLKRPDLTAAAYDDENFYKPGDAGALPIRPIQPKDYFDGRLAEDFKLTTGIRVNVGTYVWNPRRLRSVYRLMIAGRLENSFHAGLAQRRGCQALWRRQQASRVMRSSGIRAHLQGRSHNGIANNPAPHTDNAHLNLSERLDRRQ